MFRTGWRPLLALAPALVCLACKPAKHPSLDYRAEPENLVFVARVGDGKQLVDMKETPPLYDWVLDHGKANREIYDLIRWEDTIEVAVIYNPDEIPEDEDEIERELNEALQLADDDERGAVHFALSIPIELDVAKKMKKEQLNRIRDEFNPNDQCSLHFIRGYSEARVLCGNVLKRDAALKEYLLEGPPEEGPPLYGRLRFEPWRNELKIAASEIHDLRRHVQKGSPELGAEFNALALDIFDGLVREADAWVNSIDGISVQAAYDKKSKGLQFRTEITTRDPQPFLMGAAERTKERVDEPPSIFFRLPDEATGAGYSYGMSPQDVQVLQEPVKRLWKIIEKKAQEQKMATSLLPNHTLEQVTSLVESTCWSSDYAVWATGSEGKSIAMPMQWYELDTLLDAIGWGVAGFPAEAGCAELLSELLTWSTDSLSELRKRELNFLDDWDGLVIKKLPAPQFAGDDTFFVEIEVPESLLDRKLEEGTGRIHHIYILIGQSKKHEWFAFGTEKADLLKRVEPLFDGPKKNSWRKQKHMSPLWESGNVGASFDLLPNPTSGFSTLPSDVNRALKLIPSELFDAPIVQNTNVSRRGDILAYRMQVTLSEPIVKGLREVLMWDEKKLKEVEKMIDNDFEKLEPPLPSKEGTPDEVLGD